MMIFLWIFELIILIIGIMAGYLNSFLGFIVYLSCYIITINMLYINIVVTIINREKKKERNKNFVMLAILIVWLLFSYKLYSLVDDYNEVSKGLKEEFNNYKIVGLSNKKITNDEDEHCGFVFDINLEDNTNIIFQAAYCSSAGGIFPIDYVLNNYIDYYFPYYYNIYKQNNRTTFKIQMSGDKLYKIIYNAYSEDELIEFLKYLVEKTGDIEYCITLVNEDNDKIDDFCSWNNVNRIIHNLGL